MICHLIEFFHLNSLKLLDGGHTQVVFDVDAGRAKEVAGTWGTEYAKTATEAIERDDIDAIIIASPTESHFEYVLHRWVDLIDAILVVVTSTPFDSESCYPDCYC